MRTAVVLLFYGLLSIGTPTDDITGHYLAEFAVEIERQDLVEFLAVKHGLRLIRKIRGLDDVYLFDHSQTVRRSKRSAEDVLEKLKNDRSIKQVEQQRILKRVKRGILHDKQVEIPIRHISDKSIYHRHYQKKNGIVTKNNIVGSYADEMLFIDPFWPDQWPLYNFGQTGGPPGNDVNVVQVWKNGITGRGVVVCVLDDGVQYTHPDLQQNYDPDASADMNDNRDNDPLPDVKDNPDNSHGTRCAGEIAMVANNSICGVGIAFNSKIGGIRLLDGPVTDALEADALTYNNQHIDIYSSSWGPNDNGKTMEGPGTYAMKALKVGVEKGRKGKGSIFVWATGNGGQYDDDCNCDGYTSSIYTLSIGSISDKGLSTYFSEVCPSTLAVVYTGGSHVPPSDKDFESPAIKVMTTDIDGDCTLEFQGTSSAAPMAAGCFALVLEANPDLSWRDMQHLVVETARVPNDQESGWSINGAGHHINHRFGFGTLDCGRMVEESEGWVSVGPQHICQSPEDKESVKIESKGSFNRTLTVDGCHDNPSSRVDKLEHVQVSIKLSHTYRGDVNMFLTSPCGTRSEILSVRPKDDNTEGIDFTFMTVHNWGENPVGEWILTVTDNPADKSNRTNTGLLKSWSLIFYGTENKNMVPCESSLRRHAANKVGKESEEAHIASKVELKHIMADEEAEASNLNIDGHEREVLDEQKKIDRDAQEKTEEESDPELKSLVENLSSLLKSIDEKQDKNSNKLSLNRKSNIPSVYVKGKEDDRMEFKKSYNERVVENEYDILLHALEKYLDNE